MDSEGEEAGWGEQGHQPASVVSGPCSCPMYGGKGLRRDGHGNLGPVWLDEVGTFRVGIYPFPGGDCDERGNSNVFSPPEMTLATHWVAGGSDDRGQGPKRSCFLRLKFRRFRTQRCAGDR